MLLLHLLLYVFIVHQLHAKDLYKEPPQEIEKKPFQITLPKDTNYVIKYIEECPDIGYYFGRDPVPNKIEPDLCYLCFCHKGKYALCWIRDNRRCNVESFQYHKTSKKDTTATSENKESNNGRTRRSPGFFDIFNRELISKDMFGKKVETSQCKPFESSFSEDCPPADWCTGCTVCDCNSKGRWDCHILKFCPEKKKKDKKPSDKSRKIIKKKPLPQANLNTTKRISPHDKNTGPMKRGISKKIVTTQKKYIKKSISPVKKSVHKTPANKTVVKTTKRIYIKPKNKHFKTNMTTLMPKRNKVRSSQLIDDNDNEEAPLSLESQVVQNVLAAVRKMVNTELRNITTYVSKAKKGSGPTPTTKSSAYKPKYNKKLFKRENGKAHSKDGQNRYKRALEDQQEALQKVIQAENKSDTVNVTPLTTNLLIPDDGDYFTIPVTKTNEEEYYKYFVGPLLNNNEKNNSSPINTAIRTTNVNDAPEVTANTLKTFTANENQMEIEGSTASSNKDKYILYKIEATINNGIVKRSNDTALSTTNELDVTIQNRSKNTFGADTPTRVIINDFITNKTEIDPKMNELKYDKWVYFKIPRSKKLKIASENANNIIVNKPFQVHANINKRKRVSRINVPKKTNLYKILNYHKCPYLNNILKKQNETKYKIRGGMENIFKNTFNGTKKSHKKRNKMSVIMYIRKILDTIFRKNTNSEQFNRRHVLQSLCRSFGPCNFDRKDKNLLSAKLSDLDHETVSILKTVNIIKRLLILVDNNTESVKNYSKERLGYNIQRLNNILKGNYTNLTNEPLTEAKVSQLDLIKKNIENFVESVAKFTTLLNDIIAILTKRDTNLKGKNINKHLFHHGLNATNLFQSLKHMLIKYNLIQNNFIKKMYEMINNFDSKTTEKQKINYDDDISNSQTYTNLSKNILENLRKLKHLAQTLNQHKRSKREIKNDEPIEYLLLLMEYLLKQHQPTDIHPVNDGIDLLIEAIKNAPDIKTVRKKVLTNTPFNHNSTKLLHRSTPENVESNNDDTGTDTSNEDSNKILKEVNTQSPLKKNMFENKDIFEIIDDEKESEEKLQFDRRSDNTIFETTEAATSVSMFSYANSELNNPFFEDTNSSTPLEKITTIINNGITEHSNDIESGSEDENERKNIKYKVNDVKSYIKPNVFVNQFTEKVYTYQHLDVAESSNSQTYKFQTVTDSTDKTNDGVTDITTPVTEESLEKENTDKKMETVFTADIEDDEVMVNRISSTVTELTSTTSSEIDSLQNKDNSITDKTLNKNSRENADQKTKLEWIEENFHREFINYDDEKDVAQTPTKIPTTVDSANSDKKENVSSMSNEVDNGSHRKKKSKTTKNVMLKKHMELLNSLDYGTEKIELEDADTTEVNIDDRDSDSSYFVK